jgi:hypothetical protein
MDKRQSIIDLSPTHLISEDDMNFPSNITTPFLLKLSPTAKSIFSQVAHVYFYLGEQTSFELCKDSVPVYACDSYLSSWAQKWTNQSTNNSVPKRKKRR